MENVSEEIKAALKSCELCPRRCGANRLEGAGFCGAGARVKAAAAMLHNWEEPPVSGAGGAGAVFFSHCPLRCVYCQNHEISAGGKGVEISVDRLARVFLNLQQKGAECLDLVSPTQYAPHIKEALAAARRSGLNIPAVYNTGGYETERAVRFIAEAVPVFLADFKYISSQSASRYSGAADYPERAKKALAVMAERCGRPKFNERGIITGGVIVRHMLLPGRLKEAKSAVRYLYGEYGDGIALSLMNQYTPMPGATGELRRKVSAREYDSLIEYALSLGVSNCFVQESGASGEEYVPAFDPAGILEDN